MERPFTHLFFDPPYDFGRYDKLLNRIAASALAGPGSLVILERIKRGVPPSSSALETLQEIKAGESLLTLYRKKGEG